MYDASKDTDKDFLREALKEAQIEILFLRKELALKNKEKIKEEDICKILSEKFFLLRKRIFDSKQEKKKKAKNNRKNKKKKVNLPHNQARNISSDDDEVNEGIKKIKDNGEEIYLEEESVNYKLGSEEESGFLKCPGCSSDKIHEMKNCFEESSEFDVTERRYTLKRHKRQKYSCKGCDSVITAPGGVKLTPGGEFSIQIATQIACDKFEDHLPLERQRKQMKRAGLNVEVRTLFGLTEHLYNRLYPLGEMIRQDVLGEKWVHIDESPINFYNPKKSRGYIWSMSNPRGAYYQFEATRSGRVAQEMLRGYGDGVVMTDGFTGYNFLDKKEVENERESEGGENRGREKQKIKHAFCWSHVRRKFFEAMNFDQKADFIVDLIDELYDVEHQAAVIEDLPALRSTQSKAIISKIDSWVDSMESHYLDSSSMGKAINYYNQRRRGLHHFLSDKYVPIDNNMTERRQRCPVMGRKNFLHFKSINGADVGAFFYSVIESCKSNGLPPRAYINEMAHRSANGEPLESPYQYSERLNRKISVELKEEFEKIKQRALN